MTTRPRNIITAALAAAVISHAAPPPPHVYLPLVQYMPRMTSEATPAQPVPTVTPEPPVTGDVQ